MLRGWYPVGMRSRRWALIGLAVLLASLLLRGDGLDPARAFRHLRALGRGPLDGRHLALVINASDPLSEAIGRHYQAVRRIPAARVLRVHLPVRQAEISPRRFMAMRRQLLRDTPAEVQVYALAWAAPYRVGCQSITSAVSFGLHPEWCANGCQVTRMNPYYARGDVSRPWDALRIRPSMLLAAISAEQGRSLIDRGRAADGTAPDGTVYLLSTSDYKRNTRLGQYLRALRMGSPALAIRLLQQDVLRDRHDVLGYFTGLQRVEAIGSNTFRPGAVADHLTSLGGQLTGSPQMSALRWLQAGATASYGTVVEPCNYPAKFPDPGLLFAYYRRGDTLIEAYWRSVAMPGQGVFIGEPLARPWPARP